MPKGIVGRKLGMTQVFDPETGAVTSVTVIAAGPCPVVQVKTNELDGYEAVQLAFDAVPERKLTKPELGHLQRFGVSNVHFVLSETPFSLRRLDWHAGRFQVSADGGGEGLGPRPLENVIVLQVPARRLQTAVIEIGSLPIAVLKKVVLQL